MRAVSRIAVSRNVGWNEVVHEAVKGRDHL
jgi:hypothetical protein